MKEERRQQGLLGREALERKFGHLKIDFNEENVEKLAKYYNYKSHIDLYFDLAKEKINATEILKPFQVEGGKLVEIPVKTEEPVEKTTVFKTKTTTPSKEDNTILINGAPADYAYTFATCCNPVQGDDIFAYFTATSGLKIHRTNCPNATNLMANYGYRIMKAQWGSKVNESFIAKLNITGVDAGVGIIERLTHELSSFLGINIRSFSIEGLEGFFEGKITLLVANTDQLSSAIERLQNLDIVSSVSRIE